MRSCVVACIGDSFLFTENDIPSYGYIAFCFSIHQLVDICVVSILAAVNSAAANVVSLCHHS